MPMTRFAAVAVSLFVSLVAQAELIFTPRGNLLVARAATGSVSVIHRPTNRATVVFTGLPNPSGLAMRGNTLYVLIPTSIVSFTFDYAIDDHPDFEDDIPAAIALHEGHLAALAAGQTVQVASPLFRFKAVAKKVASFDDPASSPSGMVLLGNALYVLDTGRTAVHKVDLATGAISTVADLTGAVPASIRLDGDRLLVTVSSGSSSVFAIDPDIGTLIPVLTGAINAIDVGAAGGGDVKSYVVAERAGRIAVHRIGDAPVTLATVESPVSLVVDAGTREVFVETLSGAIVRIDAAAALPPPVPASIVPVIASVAGAFGSRFETSLQLGNPEPFALAGRFVLHTAEGSREIPYLIGGQSVDVIPNAGQAFAFSGPASLDVIPMIGPAPRVLARIFDTSHGASTRGEMIEQVPVRDALQAGERAVLVSGNRSLNQRTNIGVRALSGGATVRFTLHIVPNFVSTTATLALAPNELVQQSILGLFRFPGSLSQQHTIRVEVISGAAIAYAAIVDNDTQETSWHRAARVEE
jgi:hypothetical protein